MNQPSKYIWQIYGNFLPDAHGLPRVGDIIRYYRLYRRKTREEIAAALACSVEMLDEIEQHHLPLDERAKREAVATALTIPPLLLALPPYVTPLSSTEELTPEEFNKLIVMSITPVLDPLIAETYMDMLDLLSAPKENAPASSFERAHAYWVRHLLQRTLDSTEVVRDQYRVLAYEFLHQASWYATKRGDPPRAFDEATSALEQAYHLANAELIISALYRRVDILLEQKQEACAVQDFEAALWYAELFYEAVNHPLLQDAYRAAEISSCYTKIEDALTEEHEVEQLRSLYDRALAVVLEGQKAQPTEIFSLLSEEVRRAQRERTN